ncbi:universal stress protein [Halosolutus amylolyticus]|uniref:Universal stress protein n=1 Tax=Halosolutus amylolyticus TaxID=2932267 RepID=A0ABD5PWR6_9EURY|nr:universal stress protein [Halosolutus amylolyticus]
MATRILVATDGSDAATVALDHALDVAADRDAIVHVLNVADTNRPSLARLGTDVVDVLEQEGEEIVSAAADRADERGVTVSTHVVQGEPREAIVDAIAETEFDLVVMGAHGRRGLGEYVLGSVTDYVVNRSPVPVLTVRAAEDATQPFPYEDVVVPTDGSVHASAAVDLGATVAARHDATLHLLSVVDELPELPDDRMSQLSEQVTENLQEILDEDVDTVRSAGVEDVTTAIASGSVPREVTSYVDEEGIDLVVMGTHGRTGIDRHLLGSFTERVIRTSPVPVLTTRRLGEMD